MIRRHFVAVSILAAAALLIAACQTEQDAHTDSRSPRTVEAQTEPAADNDYLSPQGRPREENSPGAVTRLPETPSLAQNSPGDGDADVLFVRAVDGGDGTWTFFVTVEHADTGWQDYADGWVVLTPDGTVLKGDAESPFTRPLLHPHEDEQPFTRSQSGIEVPADATELVVRAHDLVDGFGGREVTVYLSTNEGADYLVERPRD